MKNNFITLLKAEFKGITVGRWQSKKQKTKSGLLMAGISFLAIVMFAYFAYFFKDMFTTSISVGKPEFGLIFSGIISIAFVFIRTYTDAQDKLYKGKDLKFLAAMPIKDKTVFAAKSVAILLNCYLYAALVFLPSIVAYFWALGSVNASGIFISLLAFITLPLLPYAFSLMIAKFVSVFSKSKRFSNAITIIIYTLFMIIFVVSISSVQLFLTDILSDSAAYQTFTNIFYLFKVMALAIAGDGISLLIYLAIILSLSTILFFVSATGYGKIVRSNSASKTVKGKKGELKQSRVFKTLFKKETKKYLSSGMYVFNTIFGMVMLIVATIAVLFINIPSEANEIVAIALPSVFGFLSLMSCTTACSISIEGQSFYALKAYPVKMVTRINAKSLLNIILISPICTVCAIILIFRFGIVWNYAIGLILLPICCNLFASEFGLFCNILLPKFDYNDDTAVVKRSMSVMLALMLPLVLYFALNFAMVYGGVSSYISVFIYIGVFLILSIIFFFINRTYGVKKLNRL